MEQGSDVVAAMGTLPWPVPATPRSPSPSPAADRAKTLIWAGTFCSHERSVSRRSISSDTGAPGRALFFCHGTRSRRGTSRTSALSTRLRRSSLRHVQDRAAPGGCLARGYDHRPYSPGCFITSTLTRALDLSAAADGRVPRGVLTHYGRFASRQTQAGLATPGSPLGTSASRAGQRRPGRRSARPGCVSACRSGTPRSSARRRCTSRCGGCRRPNRRRRAGRRG